MSSRLNRVGVPRTVEQARFRHSPELYEKLGADPSSRKPAVRDLILRVRSNVAPHRMLAGAETLPEIAADGEPAARGWRAGDGFVTIWLADGPGATRIVVE